MAGSTEDKEITEANASKRGRTKSDFPKDTLESALRVAMIIEESNAGQPYPPTDTAIAMHYSPGSSGYRILLSSALKYGLTAGTYKSDYISLTPLGSSAVAPSSPEERTRAMMQAALAPATFKAIFEFYRGKKLPEQKFFENTVVREFGVPKEQASKCYTIFMANMQVVGLVRKASTGLWLSNEATTTSGPSAEQPAGEEPGDEMPKEELDTASVNGDAGSVDALGVPPPPPEPVRNAIFIGHGKNRKPLEQLKSTFDSFGIPYKVAVDEANTARPISEKVAETMAECGAAILIFTADEEFRDLDNQPIWRPSENVVYELGAASIKYGGRIIIFKEEGVVLPTNFRDIGHISFKKDDLSAKTSELFKELVAFKLVRMVIGQ